MSVKKGSLLFPHLKCSGTEKTCFIPIRYYVFQEMRINTLKQTSNENSATSRVSYYRRAGWVVSYVLRT